MNGARNGSAVFYVRTSNESMHLEGLKGDSLVKDNLNEIESLCIFFRSTILKCLLTEGANSELIDCLSKANRNRSALSDSFRIGSKKAIDVLAGLAFIGHDIKFENLTSYILCACQRSDSIICGNPKRFGSMLVKIGNEFIKLDGQNESGVVHNMKGDVKAINISFREANFQVGPQGKSFTDLVNLLSRAKANSKEFHILESLASEVAIARLLELSIG